MPAYTTPGVYFEWQDAAANLLQPERVDIAGFVGIAERGPLHTPVCVESWNQFVSSFGRQSPQGYLAYAVQGFFANGGRRCWVVRVADPAAATCAEIDITGQAFGGRRLRLTAASPGVWAQRLRVTVLPLGSRFSLALRLPDGTQELWRDLTLDEYVGNRADAGAATEERFVAKLLNPEQPLNETQPSGAALPGSRTRRATGSRLVRATVLQAGPITGPCAPATLDLGAGPATGCMSGGQEGLAGLRMEHLSGRAVDGPAEWGLQTLETIAEISVVAIPDIMPTPFKLPPDPVQRRPHCEEPDGTATTHLQPPTEIPEQPRAFTAPEIRELQRELVGHCERLKNRMALLDAPPALQQPQQIVQLRREFSSSYAALYWPWLRVPDPHDQRGGLRPIPPSGHIAGIYARVDTRVGPHKPPANELVETARDISAPVDDRLHGYLNDNRVNVIRAVPGRGLRVVGARTLSADTEWMYVNVRRLLLMIERTVETHTQWLVFEPNNPALWRDLDRVVRSFLDRIWQQGMLEGATAAQAYQVICDETTNPTGEAEAGRLVTMIGVQPPWPAEFVVVRIGKTESGIEIL